MWLRLASRLLIVVVGDEQPSGMKCALQSDLRCIEDTLVSGEEEGVIDGSTTVYMNCLQGVSANEMQELTQVLRQWGL